MADNSELISDTHTGNPARNSRPDSLSLPLGQPSISFRPPVHRKHDNAQQKGKSKAPPRTAYTDVPLRLFGSQSDTEDGVIDRYSPSKTSSSSQPHRQISTASGRRVTSIEEETIEPECHEDVFLNNNDADQAITNACIDRDANSKVTMTGTLKRGKKQNVVRVSLNQHEVKALHRASKFEQDKSKDGKCGLRMGPHIFLLSLLYLPLAFITSFIVSFYIGTMCWYNIYIYLSEEKSIAHKILLCPLLIVLYPVLIILFTLLIALFAAAIQISWYFSSWYKEIKDFDKNFYGCLCEKLHVPQCSPYEVVVIDDAVVLRDEHNLLNSDAVTDPGVGAKPEGSAHIVFENEADNAHVQLMQQIQSNRVSVLRGTPKSEDMDLEVLNQAHVEENGNVTDGILHEQNCEVHLENFNKSHDNNLSPKDEAAGSEPCSVNGEELLPSSSNPENEKYYTTEREFGMKDMTDSMLNGEQSESPQSDSCSNVRYVPDLTMSDVGDHHNGLSRISEGNSETEEVSTQM